MYFDPVICDLNSIMLAEVLKMNLLVTCVNKSDYL